MNPNPFHFKESVVRSKLFLLPFLAAAIPALASAQQSKVGVINIQGAIVNTKDGQKAAADLESKFLPRRKEVDAKQAEINGMKEQLQKGQNTMSELAKQELVRKIDSEGKRLQREMEDSQAELEQDQQKALQALGQRIMVVIDKYAKDNGFTLILDVSSPQTPVLYASNTIDITKEIVDLYDKTSGSAASSSTAPAPKPPAAKPPAAKTPVKPN